jgi:hypothetical protein
VPAKADAAQRFVARVQTDPVWMAESVFGAKLWSKQREIIESVWHHERTGVKSCHGSGKTYTAALASMCFLHAFPDSIVVTTAPTWEQVRRLLWKEIGRLHATAIRRGVPLGSKCHTTDCEIDAAWFAVGLSTNDPNRFVGHHAPYILVVIDEGFGVEDWVYEVAETYMTASGNVGTKARILAIGNPTDRASRLGRAFHSERDAWNLISISAFDTPNLTGEKVPAEVARMLPSREWVEDKQRVWGEDSALYQVRVLGEFSSVGGVIPLAVIEAAQTRNLVPPPGAAVILGVDVARSTDGDETVIASRADKRIRIERALRTNDAMEVCGHVVQVASGYRSLGYSVTVVVDADGLGGPVADRLREMGLSVTDYRASASARDPDRYANRRAETWYTGAEVLRECDLDADDMLAADLAGPQAGKMTSRGQLTVEPKDVTRKRLGRSPDRADAVLMTLAPDPPQYAYAV